MPNLQNAIKQLRKDKKRTVRNMNIRADLKTLIKKAKQAIEANEKNIDVLLRDIQKMADKAAQKGTMTTTTAARKLSRIYALKAKKMAK